MLDLSPPVNYSQGYPPHRRWKPDRVSLDLVCRGYQEHPKQALLIAALGRSDAHKKPYYHPAHRSGCPSGYNTPKPKNCRRR